MIIDPELFLTCCHQKFFSTYFLLVINNFLISRNSNFIFENAWNLGIEGVDLVRNTFISDP